MTYYFFATECRSGCGGRNELIYAQNAAAATGNTLTPRPTLGIPQNWEPLRQSLNLPQGSVTQHDPVIATEDMKRLSNCSGWSPNQFLGFMS
jgi:hypothetical protein